MKIIKLILKGLLVLVIVAFVLLLVFGAVLLIGWPWWVGLFVLVGLIGLALVVQLIRKLLKRRSEQQFVQQVIAQDEAAYSRLSAKEQDMAKELQGRWKEAIEALRKSHLRKYGNPLYVLPWYMVIGESGSGKTTAIQSARLSSPFAEVTRTSGISGTRNCDWWFFEEAILIDTAGRYAMPVDEGQDKDEWRTFLNLLAKFRKKEPLNGLMVTIAADHLAQTSPEVLAQEGQVIRKRIDELMLVLGAKFPVYLMVTKCDLIQGAAKFCDLLPESTLNQAMGLLNEQLQADVQGFTNRVFSAVGERLRDLRLLLFNQNASSTAASAMMLFPEEFEKLREPMAAFVAGAFKENPYQESPLLRGVYFSSGRQEGTPFSHFLKALGMIQSSEVLAGTNKGLFLHEVFSKILPRDRLLFRPTMYMAQWRNLTRNLGLTAWVAIIIAVCGLLSYVFVKNLSALSGIRREFGESAILQGDLVADVITLDRFQTAIVATEEENRGWWVPRMGLNTSREVEIELKQKFARLYANGFLTDFDKVIGDRMTRFSAATPGGEFGAHVVLLARRINLLKARLAGEDLQHLLTLPRPAYKPAVLVHNDMLPEVRQTLGQQYIYALAWQLDDDALNTKLTYLHTWLKHLLSLPGANLNWVVDWIATDDTLAGIGMYDFWGGTPGEEAATIPAAFTQAGKDRIDAVFIEIEQALFDPLILASYETQFAQWYRDTYMDTWYAFVKAFPTGPSTLTDREQWQTHARRLLTEAGPYYALIDRIQVEFEPWTADDRLPSWVNLAYDWETLRKQAATGAAANIKDAGLVRRATSKVSSKIRRVERAVGVRARPPMDTKVMFAAGAALAAYEKALAATIPSADSRQTAFKLASDFYDQDPVTGESPFLAANRALGEIRKQMTPKATPDQEDDDLFWHLAEGNLAFMQHFVSREAACLLQERWEKEVLIEAQGISSDKDVAQLMMGSNGIATRFITGSGAPFISRSLKRGYHAKQTLGTELPFEDSFFDYLKKGAKAVTPSRGSYKVKVRAYPTDANRGAQVLPKATILEMQCADNAMRLVNENYPKTKTFTWTPQSCGDVVFKIQVGNLTLTKTYTGYTAFAKFLDDFKTGQRIFKRSEFPSEEAALRRMRIDQFKVKYQFEGHRAALGVLYNRPGRLPQKIASCWE